MHIANLILDRCIVQREADCLPNAGELLSMVDGYLTRIGNGGQLLGAGVPRPCRVCGIGQYQIRPGRFSPLGSPDWCAYACDYCDHIQFFARAELPDKPAVFDAVSDFSLQPSRNWSYGYTRTLDGDFTSHTKGQVDTDYTGVDMWHSPEVERDNGVKRNRGAATIKGKTGTFDIPPDMLHMHPGEKGGYVVVRWTCPRGGHYRVEGVFRGLDDNTTNADADVRVRLNSTTPLLDSEPVLHGIGSKAIVSARVVLLRRGNTIDFIVGVGPSGSHGSDIRA